MEKLIKRWELCAFAAICLSIALLGIGRIEFTSSNSNIGAWSVSRTTVFFWLILKLLIAFRDRRFPTGRLEIVTLAPLLLFFASVTLSLLPDFRAAGDYRYFAFACLHSLAVIDLAADVRRQRWLILLLGVLPLVLVLRGFADSPSVFSFSLEHRFGYPLDHPNTAGYFLSMSMPLCLLVSVTEGRWWRRVAKLSGILQISAILLTFSRGAWMGWVASMLFLGAMTNQWKRLIAILALAATCILLLPALRGRIAAIARPQEDQSISERIQLIQKAFQLGAENPLLGIGYGRGRLKESLRGISQGTTFEDGPIWHTHNVYVELFAGTGALGLGTFLWLFGQTLFRVLRTALRYAPLERVGGFALAASWIAAGVTGLGDVPFYHHETRIMFFTLFALAYLYAGNPAGAKAVGTE